MEFGTDRVDDVLVVWVKGSIDALTAPETTAYIDEQLTGGDKWMVLDLSQVDYVSSAGLRTILGTLKALRAQQGDLCLAGPQANVLKVLNMSGFNNILNWYDDVPTAVVKVKE